MTQLSIFEDGEVCTKGNGKIKILSLFSGIGAFEKALDNLHIPYELVGFCEIDKYAEKSYCAIHGVDESMNLKDITKVDEKSLPSDIDLVTYGFPCQDISLAGKQKGLFNEDGSQTRSGLFFDALRIIEETHPRVAIAENVKNLVGKKFNAQFQVVLASLEAAGYNNYYKVLNAKGFGIPQNRERVFIISIRKDIDTGRFEFSKPYPLTKRLKDVLETEVDEKFYLSDKGLGYILDPKRKGKWTQILDKDESQTAPAAITAKGNQNWTGNFIKENSAEDTPKILDVQWARREGYPRVYEDVAPTLQGRDYKEPKCVQVGQMYPNSGNPQAGRVYDADGISPTMDTCSGGNRMPKIIDDTYATREARVYEESAPSLRSERSGFKVAEPMALDEQNKYIRQDGCVGTIMTDGSSPKKNNRIIEVGTVFTETQAKMFTEDGDVKRYIDSDIVDKFDEGQMADISFPNGYNKGNRVFDYSPTLNGTTTKGNFCFKEAQAPIRIRKLTPKECFRLMGFDDESFHKAEAVNSNTQLYKQAGNSIVVDVLEEIFCKMFDCRGRLQV